MKEKFKEKQDICIVSMHLQNKYLFITKGEIINLQWGKQADTTLTKWPVIKLIEIMYLQVWCTEKVWYSAWWYSSQKCKTWINHEKTSDKSILRYTVQNNQVFFKTVKSWNTRKDWSIVRLLTIKEVLRTELCLPPIHMLKP